MGVGTAAPGCPVEPRSTVSCGPVSCGRGRPAGMAAPLNFPRKIVPLASMRSKAPVISAAGSPKADSSSLAVVGPTCAIHPVTRTNNASSCEGEVVSTSANAGSSAHREITPKKSSRVRPQPNIFACPRSRMQLDPRSPIAQSKSSTDSYHKLIRFLAAPPAYAAHRATRPHRAHPAKPLPAPAQSRPDPAPHFFQY